MQVSHPLNQRTLNHEQNIVIPVVLPGFNTRGMPHADVLLDVELIGDNELRVHLRIRREDSTVIASPAWVLKAPQLLHNSEGRKRE